MNQPAIYVISADLSSSGKVVVVFSDRSIATYDVQDLLSLATAKGLLIVEEN